MRFSTGCTSGLRSGNGFRAKQIDVCWRNRAFQPESRRRFFPPCFRNSISTRDGRSYVCALTHTGRSSAPNCWKYDLSAGCAVQSSCTQWHSARIVNSNVVKGFDMFQHKTKHYFSPHTHPCTAPTHSRASAPATYYYIYRRWRTDSTPSILPYPSCLLPVTTCDLKHVQQTSHLLGKPIVRVMNRIKKK